MQNPVLSSESRLHGQVRAYMTAAQRRRGVLTGSGRGDRTCYALILSMPCEQVSLALPFALEGPTSVATARSIP